MKRPTPHEPRPMPAMNIERTIDTIGVVTPNSAIASRSHTTSYTRLQKPEARKKAKYQRIPTMLVPRLGRDASCLVGMDSIACSDGSRLMRHSVDRIYLPSDVHSSAAILFSCGMHNSAASLIASFTTYSLL